MSEYAYRKSKVMADRQAEQEEQLKESAQKVSEKYPFGTKILFNDNAPKLLVGKKAYFQDVDRNNVTIYFQLFEKTREDGPTQVPLHHGWDFDMHELAKGRGIFAEYIEQKS